MNGQASPNVSARKTFFKRADKNQPAIVKALRRVGVQVVSLAAAGFGCPDLLTFKNGVIKLLEVKSKYGQLTPAQMKLFGSFARHGIYCGVVRSPSDAILAWGLNEP